MLPKKLRLSRQSFLTAKKNGQRYSSSNFSLTVYDSGLEYTRYSVITSTKIDKRAVVRNRLRRQIYEFLSKHQRAGLDVIIIPKPQVLKLSDEMVTAEIDTLLSKLPVVSTGTKRLPV